MSIKQGQISKIFVIFLFVHVSIWTLIPTLVNSNLPLDTIEALAWASDIQWGYSKHPPSSAWFSGLVFAIFSNQDWAYYLLSQLFVVLSFTIVWKFSEDFFKKQIHRLISVLLLEGIYFYNFTTPEFNVNVCQLPFWALSVLYAWKGFKDNKTIDWLLFGIFAAIGILSKYLFIYLLIAIDVFLAYAYFKKKFNYKSFISLIPFLLILLPHLIWLTENDYITIAYGLHRTGTGDQSFLDHLIHPAIFLGKQIGILIPFFIICFFAISTFKIKINFKEQKLLFLLIINIVPILLMFLTAMIMGVKIRTMWMTPFYLFFGVLVIYIFQSQINLNKLKSFVIVFIILFIFSPFAYAYVSIIETDKRTDYPGKEMANKVQLEWNKNFKGDIDVVYGNEWYAGNLSYHLKSRPIWSPAMTIIKFGGFVMIGEEFKNCEEIKMKLVIKVCLETNPPVIMLGAKKE